MQLQISGWKRLALPVVACATAMSMLASLVVRADQSSQAKTSSPDNSSASSQIDRHATRGMYLARTALSYRGVPYRWGGRSPRTGFDCSGLVQAVYAKWGIYLPRVASSQYQLGKPVKPSQLQPGDLVFFKNTYKRGLSHVGIFIGNNYFIHAARPGIGVVVSRLDKGYHKQHWAGARRLDLSKLPPVPGEKPKVEKVIIEDEADSSAPASTDAEAAAPSTLTR